MLEKKIQSLKFYDKYFHFVAVSSQFFEPGCEKLSTCINILWGFSGAKF